MEGAPNKPRIHIKRRLQSIRKHLDGNVNNYNSNTRKRNKAYLADFIKGRANATKPLVLGRKGDAEKFLGELEARSTTGELIH